MEKEMRVVVYYKSLVVDEIFTAGNVKASILFSLSYSGCELDTNYNDTLHGYEITGDFESLYKFIYSLSCHEHVTVG